MDLGGFFAPGAGGNDVVGGAELIGDGRLRRGEDGKGGADALTHGFGRILKLHAGFQTLDLCTQVLDLLCHLVELGFCGFVFLNGVCAGKVCVFQTREFMIKRSHFTMQHGKIILGAGSGLNNVEVKGDRLGGIALKPVQDCLLQNVCACLYSCSFSWNDLVKSGIPPAIHLYNFNSFIAYEFLEIRI